MQCRLMDRRLLHFSTLGELLQGKLTSGKQVGVICVHSEMACKNPVHLEIASLKVLVMAGLPHDL